VKPLPIAPATLEDIDVWGHVTRRAIRRSLGLATELINPDCDRRDAELMHWAATWRRMSWRTVEWGEVNRGWAGLLVYQGELYFGGSHYTC
jgi:hypothetical protein